MKRAKIALTAVAIFAIVGGALAIKAKRNQFTYFTTQAGASGCPALAETATTNLVAAPTALLATSTNCAGIVYHITVE